jgi:hypothetical protein
MKNDISVALCLGWSRSYPKQEPWFKPKEDS